MDVGHFHSIVSGFIGPRSVTNHLKMTNCISDVLQAVLQPVASNDCWNSTLLMKQQEESFLPLDVLVWLPSESVRQLSHK
jgi:hypothetical protein